MKLRHAAALTLLALLSSCARYERAKVAAEARTAMLGMSDAQLLACIRGPSGEPTLSGQIRVPMSVSGTVGSGARGGPPVGSGFAILPPGLPESSSIETEIYSFPSGADAAASRSPFDLRNYCLVKVVLHRGSVSEVSYSGKTGGWLAPDDQCAFAVQECVRERTSDETPPRR